MKRLKILREERLMSQSSLASKLSLSQQSIHKYENGLAEPDIDTLIKIADIFHTSVDYLIGHDSIYSAGDNIPLDNTETLLIEIYRNADTELKNALRTILERLYDFNEYKNVAEDPPDKNNHH